MFAYWVAREGGCKNQNADGKRHVLNEIADGGWGKGRRSLINVNWYDAECYAQWLTEKTGTKKLPSATEAEWECAARVGTTTVYYWGTNDPKEYAWFGENSNNKNQPVGQRLPNAFDLYDMAGNVWEWVQDCWHKNYQKAPSAGKQVWLNEDNGECEYRVLRGGSWDDRPGYLRSAPRSVLNPDYRFSTIGFRLAQD